MKKVDDTYRDFDRRHLMRFFEMAGESEYDPFSMIRAYAGTFQRKRADEGEAYFIFRQPVTSVNDVLLANELPHGNRDVDPIILHWMADFYLFGHYDKNMSFEEMMEAIDPEWLYGKYNPLHEASIPVAWDKVVNT